MKLKFKKQAFQSDAVQAVADCFAGQPKTDGVTYRIDPGKAGKTLDSGRVQVGLDFSQSGFRNRDIVLTADQLLTNIRAVQQRQNLPVSPSLVTTKVCPVNLDIEMETGTGKTYCYIKTLFELNRRFGWSKFIVVVPSIAIREGVYKTLDMTAEHFMAEYNRRARFFIYNSKQLHHLEQFSSDGGVNVMIINVQAFNARGQDARRIYEELDDFQSRKPIDVIAGNHPIMILDEPQKLEGAKTFESLKAFSPLAILRYSATHKTEHNKIYRLDALDAYNQKLVKKIAVRGITVRGLTGTHAYLYLESIQISTGPPLACIEFEARTQNGIQRRMRRFGRNDNLFDLSGGLDQYREFIIADIDALKNTVSFSNGIVLESGEATGDVNESTLRRIQIREAVATHLEKERALFPLGIKVLSLFFIDEVSKYRRYDDGIEQPGEYARIFEEEYRDAVRDQALSIDAPYRQYLSGIGAEATHNGYFSIDKRSRRLVDPTLKARSTEADDADAYDLILKDKERLLSLDEPVRFIFSHSALSEGWDNPNVFVICTLKHSDSSIRKRQEVGRGLRLCVNQSGDRIDSGADVHDINVLTVVASESYRDFTAGLQKEIVETLSARPRKADEAFFIGKIMETADGAVTITDPIAKQIYRYLVKNDYTDDTDAITPAYHDARKNGTLAPLPAELAPYTDQIVSLIDGVFSEAVLPEIEDSRKGRPNFPNANIEKAEFQALWEKINRKAAYTVHFDTAELIRKCVAALDKELQAARLQYTVQRGEQREAISYDEMKSGQGFAIRENETGFMNVSAQSAVRYDLIGHIAEDTRLTRRTVAEILKSIQPDTFSQYRLNPEDFMLKAAGIINEQKATMVVEHLTYRPLEDRHELQDIFTVEKRQDFGRAVPVKRHVYDYVFTDSTTEKAFVTELDNSVEVVVYTKLPRKFFIPTPVGNYNPDWAIAFREGSVKHIFFVAETKGYMSSMELRKIEESKIACARRFFAGIATDQVRYDVVSDYARLMQVVK
jgi:type III restriction enzyme